MMTQEIKNLIERKALFVVSHSGGKDSQAMYLWIKENVPTDQIHVIHADLPGVEWEGTEQHILDTIDSPYSKVTAVKTFFEMVERRGMWPSPSYRQCTSDLKTGPIDKEIRRISKESGNKLIVNCMGIRAQESSSRAKKNPFKLSKRNSRAGREWYDWMPIFEWSERDVFKYIEINGQEPHWAYGEGMSRLSCCFCIMSSKSDLKAAAKLNPGLLNKYVEMEKKIDHTFIMPTKKNGRKFLDEIINAA